MTNKFANIEAWLSCYLISVMRRGYPDFYSKLNTVFWKPRQDTKITSQHFFLQKLSYINNNPCSGVWKLVEAPVDYKHSSARFYGTGEQDVYLIDDK